MREAARARMGIVELTRIGFAVVNQLLDRFPWRGWMHHHDLEALGDLSDRCKVLDRVITGVCRYRRNHGERARVADYQRIAVPRRTRDRPRPNSPTCATAIFNDHRLYQPGRKNLRREPGRKIAWSSRRRRHDDLDGPGGIVLRRKGVGGAQS